ncbi:hypothetical protein MtrunA17_Chr3g0100821 [Medicago truncatula]|uniref:Uncharacterized protein n=1 Tax=Medicago truncatula TaxID=3880 RepID=A0A396INN0_MEDTR|nr:hypothetical protein MtrunA17_Chr3g0100821 [Medicago truncatula]
MPESEDSFSLPNIPRTCCVVYEPETKNKSKSNVGDRFEFVVVSDERFSSLKLDALPIIHGSW